MRSFDRKVILIAGGKDKGVAFDEFGVEIVKRVKTLILTGMTAEGIRSAVLDARGQSGVGRDENISNGGNTTDGNGTVGPEILMGGDFPDAVRLAASKAEDRDIVLLSPACTSFDRFKNFEERGELFREIVNALE